MKLIVNADKNWGIGKGNELLVHIPSDMKFFRETTTGHIIVMGRKTLESFPNQMPLPKRTNIVLTTNKDYNAHGAIVVGSKEELLSELKEYHSDEIYIIGGESIYNMMLPYCDEAYVTNWTMHMMPILFFRISMRWKIGILPRKVMSRLFLILNIRFVYIKEENSTRAGS